MFLHWPLFQKMVKAKNRKKLEKEFRSSHSLIFEDGGPFRWDQNFRHFRIGTVQGLYGSIDKSYCVLAIINNSPGNGHILDFYQYFERSCRRDGYSFRILELTNPEFKKHLIQTQGFKDIGNNHVEKIFTTQNKNK